MHWVQKKKKKSGLTEGRKRNAYELFKVTRFPRLNTQSCIRLFGGTGFLFFCRLGSQLLVQIKKGRLWTFFEGGFFMGQKIF